MWRKPGGTHPGSDSETENQTDGWAQGCALRRGKKRLLGAQAEMVWEGLWLRKSTPQTDLFPSPELTQTVRLKGQVGSSGQGLVRLPRRFEVDL